MEQVRVREQSALAGRTIMSAGIRQKFGVIVVAVRRSNGEMEFNPSPETSLQAGDELVVLGRPDNVKALEETVEEL
jgi:voltage-gated potassium channel